MATVFIEIPIHRQHENEGYDLALFIDVWLRKLPWLIEAPFIIYLLCASSSVRECVRS